MIRLWFVLGIVHAALCLAWLVPSQAQCSGMTAPPIPFATETLTISNTVMALTPAKYQPTGSAASMAMVTMESGDIRYALVGSPTASQGHYVGSLPPQTFMICGLDSIKAFRAIRISTDAHATITYYKPKAP